MFMLMFMHLTPNLLHCSVLFLCSCSCSCSCPCPCSCSCLLTNPTEHFPSSGQRCLWFHHPVWGPAWIMPGTSGRFPQKRNTFFCFGRVGLNLCFDLKIRAMLSGGFPSIGFSKGIHTIAGSVIRGSAQPKLMFFFIIAYLQT